MKNLPQSIDPTETFVGMIYVSSRVVVPVNDDLILFWTGEEGRLVKVFAELISAASQELARYEAIELFWQTFIIRRSRKFLNARQVTKLAKDLMGRFKEWSYLPPELQAQTLPVQEYEQRVLWAQLRDRYSCLRP